MNQIVVKGPRAAMDVLMTPGHTCVMDKDVVYRCGDCSQTFSTMCLLHKHFIGHDSEGSFHFDNFLKVAFAKYDSACASTQTEGILMRARGVKSFDQVHRFKKIKSQSLSDKLQIRKNTETACSNYGLKGKLHKGDDSIREQHSRILNEKKYCLRNFDKMQALEQPHNSGKNTPFIQIKTHTSFESIVPSGTITEKACPKSQNESTQIHESKEFENHVPVDIHSLSEKLEKDLTENTRIIQMKDMTGNGTNPEMVQQLEAPDLSNSNNDCMVNELRDVNKIKDFIENPKEKQHVEKKMPSTSNNIQHGQNCILSLDRQASSYCTTVKVTGTWSPTVYLDDWQQHMNADISTTSQVDVETKEGTEVLTEKSVTIRKQADSRITCKTCGKTVIKSGYEDHQNIHLGKTPYICEICGKRYRSKRSLAMHKVCTHLDESERLECRFCDKKFPIKSRLKEHMVTHTKEKEFICKECGRIFFTKHSLIKHRKHMHQPVLQYHQCQKCNKNFKSKFALKEHVLSHTQTFSCNVCGQSFSRYSSRQRHLKTHTGDKPHKCHICGHEFIQKTPFWVHMEKHHDLTKTQLIQLLPRASDKSV